MRLSPAGRDGSPHFEYTADAGYFQHDEEPACPGFRATISPGLGLLNRSYHTDVQFDPERQKTQWQRFEHFVFHLNRLDPGKVRYKVIYLARHGLGYHNVMEAAVGREKWESHWARMEGNDTMTWVDARLLSKIPQPEKYYTSPLTRCLEIVSLTFSNLFSSSQIAIPVVKELLREHLGVHTCDRRSTRSWIQANYPTYNIEPGFTEDDELWDLEVRESLEAHIARTKVALDEIFSDEEAGTFISFTVHSGTIRALYEAIRHRDVWVAAGAVVPVLARAVLV